MGCYNMLQQKGGPNDNLPAIAPAWQKGVRKAAMVEDTVWQCPCPWQANFATSSHIAGLRPRSKPFWNVMISKP